MKIEKIATNKIKVVMSAEDLIRHGISFESFALNSQEVQDFFWDIIRKAEYEADFFVEGGRVIVEAMPLKNDGIVIFVTKPESLQESENAVRIKRPRFKIKEKSERDMVQIYRFADFEDLYHLAQQWRYLGERSSLYSYDDRYYLVLEFERDAYDKQYVEAKLFEYADRIATITEAYLGEHGKQICDGDAITSILKYFGRPRDI